MSSCVKKGQRHQDSQIKVATSHINQLTKSARGNQEHVNFAANRETKRKLTNDQKFHVIGVVVTTKNQDVVTQYFNDCIRHTDHMMQLINIEHME